MEIHFINVGFGNMTLMLFPNGITYLYDCNITENNESRVFSYLNKSMGSRYRIDAFICSHRDADHMRGIKKVHKHHPITIIKDAGVPGTTTDSPEYKDYMDLRRNIGSEEIKPRQYLNIDNAKIQWMNAKHEDLFDANDQSIVMKIEYLGSSAILTGDTSSRPWKEKILPNYSEETLSANIILASHHGSISFFNDPNDEKNYYIEHIKKIMPGMTIISVGPNIHLLPDLEAIELYEKYSTGSDKGHKVFTTEDKGNIKLILEGNNRWSLHYNH